MKVLVVDDSKVAQLTLKNIFNINFKQFNVKCIDDTFDAISLLRREKFDLIISDYNMLYLNGDIDIISFKMLVGKTPVILLTSDILTSENISNINFKNFVIKDEFISASLTKKINEILYLTMNFNPSNVTLKQIA